MKLKSKKSALLMSFTSLLICFAMLVGSTFAWFTDTATTGVNKITSGNLHVEIQDKADKKIDTLKWVDKDGNDIANQEKILWEPGCTYLLTPFKIVNTGNLALKYKIVITGLDGDSPLLDVIKFTYKINGVESSLEDEGHLKVGETTKMITVSAHMDELANNDYMAKTLENVKFTVYATQDTVENDSFNNQYDKDAAYYPVIDATSLKSTLSNGGTIEFGENIDLTGTGGSEQASLIKNGSVDFKGKTLKGTLEVGTYSSTDAPLDVVIKDTVGSSEYSVKAAYRKEANGSMMQSAAIQVYKPTVTIESGKYTCNNAVINCQVQGVFGADGTQWKWSATNPQPLPTEFMTVVKVEGGQFDATAGGVCLANIIGKAVINNGLFTAKDDGAFIYADSGDSNQETVTIINGGTFTSDDSVAFYFGSGKGNIIVNGGTFEAKELVAGEDGTLIINGGTFNVDPGAYVANGHTVTNNEDGTWTVQ